MAIEVQFLGTRGNIRDQKPWYRNHSGILIDSLLFDFGEPKFLDEQPEAIFITHLHPDHACFVNQPVPDVSVPIYAPEAFHGRPKVQELHERVQVGNFQVTPIPTVHSMKVRSQAYLIEGKGRRILYTGDIITIEKPLREQLGRLDLVITDASYIQNGGFVRQIDHHVFGHTGIPNLIRLFAPYTHRIIFTHFGSWFVHDVAAGKAEIHKLDSSELHLETAYDGRKVRIAG